MRAFLFLAPTCDSRISWGLWNAPPLDRSVSRLPFATDTRSRFCPDREPLLIVEASLSGEIFQKTASLLFFAPCNTYKDTVKNLKLLFGVNVQLRFNRLLMIPREIFP